MENKNALNAGIIDTVYAAAVMESAGQTLSMLHVPGCWPAGFRSCMPDYMQEFSDLIGVSIEPTPAKMQATIKQVNELETAFGWMVSLGSYCRGRQTLYVAKTVAMAFPRHPDTGRQKISWRKMSARFGCSDKTVKSWYEDGIKIIVRLHNAKIALPEKKFFSENPQKEKEFRKMLGAGV